MASLNVPSVPTYSEPWTPSMRPISEEKLATELRRWRRWSNHFERNLTMLGFDMNQDCANCGGDSSWDYLENKELAAIKCRNCGFQPQEATTPTLKFPSRNGKMFPSFDHESSSVSSPSTTAGTDFSALESIDEHDFAFRKRGESSASQTVASVPNGHAVAPSSSAHGSNSSSQGPRASLVEGPEDNLHMVEPRAISSSKAAVLNSPAQSEHSQHREHPYLRQPAFPSPPVPAMNFQSPQHDNIASQEATYPAESSSSSSQPAPVMLQPVPAVMPRKTAHAHARNRSRVISSIRQSMAEPPRLAPRWYEANHGLTFKFVLKPRGKASVSLPDPDAAPSGSVSAPSSSGADAAAATSSHPPGKGGNAPSTQGVSLAELANDPTALQRLLTCAMFMMNDIPEKDGPAKRLDLGLVSARTSGSRHFAMKHENKLGMGISTGSGKSSIPLADEEGRMIETPATSAPSGSGTSKRIMWKISVR